jgi:hypothetical protein
VPSAPDCAPSRPSTLIVCARAWIVAGSTPSSRASTSQRGAAGCCQSSAKRPEAAPRASSARLVERERARVRGEPAAQLAQWDAAAVQRAGAAVEDLDRARQREPVCGDGLKLRLKLEIRLRRAREPRGGIDAGDIGIERLQRFGCERRDPQPQRAARGVARAAGDARVQLELLERFQRAPGRLHRRVDPGSSPGRFGAAADDQPRNQRASGVDRKGPLRSERSDDGQPVARDVGGEATDLGAPRAEGERGVDRVHPEFVDLDTGGESTADPGRGDALRQQRVDRTHDERDTAGAAEQPGRAGGEQRREQHGESERDPGPAAADGGRARRIRHPRSVIRDS